MSVIIGTPPNTGATTAIQAELTQLRPRASTLGGAALILALLGGLTASAGTRYFYGTSGCSGGGGNGYWVQQGGGTFYYWKTNDDGVCSGQLQWATGDDAIFGGAAGNVTVRTSGNHTCNRIEVRTGGYKFAATGGNLASVIINTGRFTVTSGTTTIVNNFGGATNKLRFYVAGGNPLLVDGAGTLDFEGTNATIIDAAKVHVTGGGTLISIGPASIPRTPTAFLADAYMLDANSTLYFKDYGPAFGANLGLTLGDTGGGQIRVDGGYTATFAAPISGGTILTKLGAGKLMLSGDSGATFTGAIEIGSGIVGVGHNNALGGAVVGTTVSAGAALEVNGNLSGVVEPITLNGTGPAGAGALCNLVGDNMWLGAITLGSTGVRINSAAGTLTLSGGVAGSGDPDLVLGGAGNILVQAAPIDLGSGVLTKDGPGTLTVDADGSQAGATLLSEGSLVVNAGFSSGTLTVSGGSLGGTGTLTGAVEVRIGGTLAPGHSIGALTLATPPALEGDLRMGIDTSHSPNADKLVIASGALVCGGTLTLTNHGPELAGGETFDLFDATAFDGAFETVSLPAVGAGLNWWLGDLTNAGTLTVNRAPTAQDKSYTRARGTSLKIELSDLLAGATDPDSGDAPNAASLAGAGSQGAIVTETSSFILYQPVNDSSDTLQFRVTDCRGGATTNNLYIAVSTADGQGRSVSVCGSSTTVSFAGIPGYSYVVQRATNVGSISWVDLAVTSAPAGGLFEWVDDFSDLGAPPASAYYRLQRP